MEGKYTLTYFPAKGVGEGIRFLLAYSGLDFEDTFVQKENWPKVKDSTPFGQLPTLEYKGKVANQSSSIARYVAKKAKLVGANDWEDLEIDAIVDTIKDCGLKAYVFVLEQDPKKKEILKDTYLKETLPYSLDRFEKIAKANNGHLGINKLNWSDFIFAAFIESFNELTGRDLLEGYPNLQVVMNTVLSLPAIKTWIANRPQ